MIYNDIVINYHESSPIRCMEIHFWEDAQKNCPVQEFLRDRRNAELETVEKINDQLDRVEQRSFSELTRSDTLKKLKGFSNLYEIRVPVKRIEYRFLGALKNNQIWLVHVFKKKRSETEPRHLGTALNRTQQLL